MSITLLHGDCREVLDTLPECSVQCCVTSPPYWGLRSYLPEDHPSKPLEIGSEPTVDEWVATMVDVFRRVRRVLRDDGVLFLNLGDSYASNAGGYSATGSRGTTSCPSISASTMAAVQKGPRRPPAGLKPKDLVGQPWMAAFALRADGWWLRQELIWAKNNPMPESARDRCTKSHEHIFLLSKSGRYFWNFDAVQEPVNGGAHARRSTTGVGFGHGFDEQVKPRVGRREGPPGNPAARKSAEAGVGIKNNDSMDAALAESRSVRNPRSVWSFPTEPFKGAHFATFPQELARRCITAGTREGDTVLDPFGGSGTVGLVADGMQRHAILIDIDERNLPMANERIAGDAPLFAEVTTG